MAVWYLGTVRYASIFARKYGTLVRYAGTVRFFCNGTGTIRQYITPFLQWYGYGKLVWYDSEIELKYGTLVRFKVRGT